MVDVEVDDQGGISLALESLEVANTVIFECSELVGVFVCHVLSDWYEMQLGACELGVPTVAYLAVEELELVRHIRPFISQ